MYTRCSSGSRAMTAGATVRPPNPLSNIPIGRSSATARGYGRSRFSWRVGASDGPFRQENQRSEVDDLLRALFDLVEVVSPGAGRQVLPATVADDVHDHALVDALGDAGRAGEGRAGRDARERSDVGHAPRPLERLAGAHDALAVEQL